MPQPLKRLGLSIQNAIIGTTRAIKINISKLLESLKNYWK